MRRHRTTTVEKGWMPFYHERPYWPLFHTKPEAANYALWKGGKDNPNMKVKKCTVRITRTVEVEG